MKRRGTILAISTALALGACNNPMKIQHLPYPETPRGEVVDNYFGTEVADPYRWLEDDNSAETAAWVKAQNAVTQDYLSKIPFREALKERIAQLMDYPTQSAPARHGDYEYFYANDGLQNQSVLYRRPVGGGDREVFLDPNTLSEDGTVALAALDFSEDDRYAAYAAAASGSDWVVIRVMEITPEGKRLLDDEINWVKFSGATWAPDSKGFYYSAYDAPSKSVYSAQNQGQKVYYHKLGTPQSDDRLIYSDPAHPLRYFEGWERAGWLFISASEGTSGSEILYRPANSGGAFKTLFKGFAHDYGIVECKDDKLYYTTNDGAENQSLHRIDLKTLKDEVLIPEGKNMLEGVSPVGGCLFATYLDKAQSRIEQYDMEGRHIRTVELPAIGTASGFYGKKEDRQTYYSLSTYTSPATLYRYDIETGVSELYYAPEVNFDPSLYMTEQVFYPSKDGTQVSMFITRRKDFKKDGQAPCYLYGYGGFQINMTPGFSPSSIALMEQGGIYCVANLRGGSEYGEAWHKGGMLVNKQNVFDDFIAAAEWLIANGYTSREKLAISGGSNGGLLVGACEVQRPDLYAVCLPAVGVMDMLRYHKFTIGWGWAVEYGTSEDEEQFGWIYPYSPLHNIRQGVRYPATLVTTGDHDDRVVPAHSFKYAATMQYAQAGDAPVLIRIESNAGHGAGKPTSKRIEEAADCMAFMMVNTGTKYRPVNQ